MGTAITLVMTLALVAGGVYLLIQYRRKAIEAAGSREIYDAQKAVVRAERAHSKAVQKATAEVVHLQSSQGKKLGSFHGVKIYEMWIETPHGSGPIAGATASVESQFSQRLTATRMLALGVFSLAAPKRTGEVYLTIETPTLASMVRCTKDENQRARSFAVEVVNAGKSAAVIAAQRPAQIQAAQASLARIRGDRTAVEAARAKVAELESALPKRAIEGPS